MIGLLGTVGWQQVGKIQPSRVPLVGNGQGGEGIQPQEQQIHQIFLGERIRFEVRMQQAQSAQPPGSLSRTFEFRNKNGAWIAHNDHLGPALSVNEQSELPPHGKTQFGDFPGLFVGIKFVEGETDGGRDVPGP